MYTTWPNLLALRAARWPLGGGTARSRGVATEGEQERGVGGEHGGLMVGYRQHLVGMISIGREIDKYDKRMTNDQAPGSGRAKLGKESTMEWS